MSIRSHVINERFTIVIGSGSLDNRCWRDDEQCLVVIDDEVAWVPLESDGRRMRSG